MISHLFKMLWNRRRHNFLLLLELFFSFLVLMVVCNFILMIGGEYWKSAGYSHQISRVMVYQLRWENTTDQEASQAILRVTKYLQSWPEVIQVASTRNSVPYMNDPREWHDARYQGQVHGVRRFEVDDYFAKVLEIPLVAGHWFSPKENSSKSRPIVINEDMQAKIFNGKNPVGEVIRVGEEDRVIIGVAGNAYSGGLAKPMPAFFERNNPEEATYRPAGNLLIKFKKDIGVQTYDKMDKVLRNAGLSENWINPQMGSLELFRSIWYRELMVPLMLVGIVAGFLFINVVVGLYGVFWQNINRRKAEIGLRRAIGARSGEIYRQMVGEVIVLATLAIVPGLLLGVQFLIFDTFGFIDSRIYVGVMLFSALFIYLLVTLCALYPGWIASRIQPAEALHEE